MLLEEGTERAGDGLGERFFDTGPEDLVAVGGGEGGREGRRVRDGRVPLKF